MMDLYKYHRMLGAICGDVAGSIYERYNIKYHLKEEELINELSRFTDDSVMTVAVAEGICKGLQQLPTDWMNEEGTDKIIFLEIQTAMQKFGRLYPNAGYGRSFYHWIYSADPKPYHSWGNGSAMRASYAGWAANSLMEAEKLGEISASVTHDHSEGIKGAMAVAGGIYMLRTEGKDAFFRYITKNYYKITFTLDEIREEYQFDVSCQGSVPQAIEAFLEGNSFSEVISNAISIGGDSDTIAAIAGSFAETIYEIPENMKKSVVDRLGDDLKGSLICSNDYLESRSV